MIVKISQFPPFRLPLSRFLSSFPADSEAIGRSAQPNPSSSSPSQLETARPSAGCIQVNCRDKWPAEMLDRFLVDCSILEEFVTEKEEAQLLAEVEPHMKRMRWEEEHWDQQIHLYREREQRRWSAENQQLIDRIWAASFPDPKRRSPFVHVLDLHPDGFIRPHLDEARYCGAVISGLSLLSPSVMRLRHQDSKWADHCWADLLLPRRSLYRLSGIARFEFTHEILANAQSHFRGEPVPKQRRISVICREFPEHKQTVEEVPANVMRPIPPPPIE